MDVRELTQGAKVVGRRAVQKAIEKENAAIVFLACDAETRITAPLKAICEAKGIPTVETATMAELGQAARLAVGAAAAALIK